MQRVGIAELNAFAEVAARRSFAKAADHLGLSRSTLSATIRATEEKLGVRLLNRTTRSVAPTEAGERLLARLRPVLDDFAAAIDSMNAFRDTPAGLLRLTVAPPAKLVLEPILARFLAEHPAISLEVSVDAALRNIVSERFDAGIRAGERIDRDMVALRLGAALRFLVAASPEYLKRRPVPAAPHELQAHDCIRLRFPSGAIQPWVFERAGQSLEVAVSGQLILNDGDLALRAALDGVGFVYFVADYLAPLIGAGRLTPALESWMPRGTELYLYYPARRQLPAALRAFLGFLRRERRIGG